MGRDGKARCRAVNCGCWDDRFAAHGPTGQRQSLEQRERGCGCGRWPRLQHRRSTRRAGSPGASLQRADRGLQVVASLAAAWPVPDLPAVGRSQFVRQLRTALCSSAPTLCPLRAAYRAGRCGLWPMPARATTLCAHHLCRGLRLSLGSTDFSPQVPAATRIGPALGTAHLCGLAGIRQRFATSAAACALVC